MKNVYSTIEKTVDHVDIIKFHENFLETLESMLELRLFPEYRLLRVLSVWKKNN